MMLAVSPSRKTVFRAARWCGLCAALTVTLAGCTTVDSLSQQVFGPSESSRQTQGGRHPAMRAAEPSWTGTYQGMLPCNDCAGVRVALSLFRDATYELQTDILGTNRHFTRRGSFTFNADETHILLDANGQNRSFEILSPTRLRMLDKDGQRIRGVDADRYVLSK